MTHIRTPHSSKPTTGQIIEADMRAFFAAGFSIKLYTRDHVIDALLNAGIDPTRLPYKPGELLLAVLEDFERRGMKQ